MLEEDLALLLQDKGVPIQKEETRRLLSHALAPDGLRNENRRPLAKRLKEAVFAQVDPRAQDRLTLLERVADPVDGFVKYLFQHEDGALSEAVRIPLHKKGCYSICLSSQVGCAMKCLFCATGRLGLSRNLMAWEIVAAFLKVREDTEGRVTGAVFQGQGEPLHNYEEVLRAARILSSPSGCNVGASAITISTVGLVPQILRYAREGHPYRLIISLSSAIVEKRAHLLPVAGRFSLSEVAEAIRAYHQSTGDRVTIAWVLLSGVNTGKDEAEALSALLPDVPLRINLIDVNDTRSEKDGGYARASDEERKTFMGHLQILKAPIVRRYSGGAGRHAACGMLAAVRCDVLA